MAIFFSLYPPVPSSFLNPLIITCLLPRTRSSCVGVIKGLFNFALSPCLAWFCKGRVKMRTRTHLHIIAPTPRVCSSRESSMFWTGHGTEIGCVWMVKWWKWSDNFDGRLMMMDKPWARHTRETWGMCDVCPHHDDGRAVDLTKNHENWTHESRKVKGDRQATRKNRSSS